MRGERKRFERSQKLSTLVMVARKSVDRLVCDLEDSLEASEQTTRQLILELALLTLC